MAHNTGPANDQELEPTTHMSRRAVNAQTIASDKHFIKKTETPKTIHIIGGGIGGMEAARVLKLRGHNPIIYEKTDQLGGVFISAGKPEFKGRLRELLEWYRKQMADLEIEIHYNYDVRTIKEFGDDPVIIATGSAPRKLRKIPGFEKMIEATDYLNGAPVKRKVAVIGGGLTGCEIAYDLALEGKKPVIIEMTDDLIKAKGVCLANSSYLREWFYWKKVPVYLNTSLKEVHDEYIVCSDKEGNEFEIPCNSVISSVGYMPAPLERFEKTDAYLVGDCNEVGNLRTVIWGAYETAMKI